MNDALCEGARGQGDAMQAGLTISGKYTLKSQIGRGGMGSVWVARNDLIEREFAIKFLHPAAAADPKVRERFLREARIPGRARHPNIVEVFDVGTAPELDNMAFMVMELLDGVPLDVAIRALGGLPIRLALLVGAAIGRALDAAHGCGVLHRDLKPANVFLHRSHSGHLVPKLVDFGISKIEDATPVDPEMELTRAGTVLGSPLYMSPEQALGERNLDARSDLHALGVTMFWCIAGRSPFASKRFDMLLAELTSSARPRLSDVRPDVPAGVSALVSKAFAADRAERFQTGAELVAAIEAELSAMGPGSTLETRASVEELFGRLRAAGVQVSEMRPGHLSSPSSPSASRASQPPLPPSTIGSANSAFAASVRPEAPASAPSGARRAAPWVVGAAALACVLFAGVFGVGWKVEHARSAAGTTGTAMHAAPAMMPTMETTTAPAHASVPALTQAPAPAPALAPAPAPELALAPAPESAPAEAAPAPSPAPRVMRIAAPPQRVAVAAQPSPPSKPAGAGAGPAVDELPQTRW
jgi:serine/threonine-protein kinase